MAPTQSVNSEKLLSPSEIAEVLGVRPSWIYRQTMLKGPGAIPRLKLGKYLRFTKSDVLAWIFESQQAGSKQ